MKTKPRDSIQLVWLKRRPEKAEHFKGRQVCIWSKEWLAWWRPDGAGYTNKIDEAGIFDFEDALNRSRHAGPEKGIVYYATESLFPQCL